ncbi:MAG: bifunctional pyr operon transcriptional regulator/uracil phosphoribosyltransferase, partial [Bacilli bacterium]|nr:bifunctional pyr operon transcriptional regulator/uracil phosphoribosyltransferase [Bacilli bacterium]
MEFVVMNNETLKRTLRRLSYEIIEKHKILEDVILMGIKNKGVIIASIIANMIQEIEGKSVEKVDIDISEYRDDQKTIEHKNINKETIHIDI